MLTEHYNTHVEILENACNCIYNHVCRHIHEIIVVSHQGDCGVNEFH